MTQTTQGTPGAHRARRAPEDEALRVRAARQQARFEQSAVAQASVDLAGRLVQVNSALCQLLGRSRKDLQRRYLWELPAPDGSRSVNADLVARVLSGEVDSEQFECAIVRPDQTAIAVSVSLTVLRDDSGTPFEAAAFFHDLTQPITRQRRQHQQERYFAALSRMAGDLTLVTDSDGRIVYTSPAIEPAFGYRQAQLVGEFAWEFVHPDDLSAAKVAFDTIVRSGGSQAVLLRMRHTDGSWRWVEQIFTSGLDDVIGGIVSSLRDVTERVESERALRESDARLRAIAECSEEGIWALSPDGRTVFANTRMAAILGVPLAEVYERSATSFLDPATAVAVRERLRDPAARQAERDELCLRRPDGQQRHVVVVASTLRGEEGDVMGTLAMVSDVTQLRRMENDLRQAALHDPLTGLPNRALLLDRLDHALLRAATTTAVMFVDLDHFKLINESRGHEAGDEVIVAVGQRLRLAARRADTVGRFGGDEFVVIAEDIDETGAQRLAEELLVALSQPLAVGGLMENIAASIGVSLSAGSATGVAGRDLLRYAHTAMYAAKAAGRGRIRLFDQALADEAEAKHVLATDLRAALAEDGLTMHYQPLIDLESGRVVGIEALARWTHAHLGKISPERFVGIAESTGLAPLLDRWAVARALKDAFSLRSSGAIPVDAYLSINLSATNVSDHRLEDYIISSTSAAGLEPADVVLELTEQAIMSDADSAIPLLRRLRARGFRLAIDDFGTGHSSLAYLRDLPASILKIDRSFISGIREDSDALAVATSIVGLARALGMTVIAEGVEDAGQAHLLRTLGCHAAQGWLWSAAKPPNEIVATPWTGTFDVGDDTQPPMSRRRATHAQVKPEHGLDRLLSMHRKGASPATIAAALNADGYLTPAGVRWHSRSVARAITDAT